MSPPCPPIKVPLQLQPRKQDVVDRHVHPLLTFMSPAFQLAESLRPREIHLMEATLSFHLVEPLYHVAMV